jgi:sugar phosphate isomerase/epimerase
MSDPTAADARPSTAPSTAGPAAVLDPEPASAAAAGPIDGLVPGLRTVRAADGRVLGTVAGGNPLAGNWEPPAEFEGDLILWSGTLGESLTEAHPHTWMGPGRERLAARVDELLPRVQERGVRLLLRAHARQVLSDPPSVRAFLRDRAESPVGLLLEPAALFEASMLGPEAEDHVHRILSGLGDLANMLLLSDVAAAGEAGDCLQLVAPGAGRLPADVFAAAVDRWVGPGVPRIIRAEHRPDAPGPA